MDEDFFDSYEETKQKTINIYKNGDNTKKIQFKINECTSFQQLKKQIIDKLGLFISTQFRLFNSEGVEMYQDDMNFIKNNSNFYASGGEEFDQSSCFSEYQIIKELGKGGFGKVMLGQHKENKKKVAIKIVEAATIGNATDIDMVFREAEMLKTLRHPNIVKIKNCFTLKSMQVVFIMEYLEGGELLRYIENKQKLSEEEAKLYFSQICKALQYCHKEKIIHRDLKLENVLLQGQNKEIAKKNIQIIDFGIAGASAYNFETADAGTLQYMAPEMLRLKNPKSSTQLDIWALGVMLYGMVVGQLPFVGTSKQEIIEKIKLGEYKIPIGLNKTLSNSFKDLLKKMLQVDPLKRIDIQDIIDHAWLKKNDQIDFQQIMEDPEEESDKEVSKMKDNQQNQIGRKGTFILQQTKKPTILISNASNQQQINKAQIIQNKFKNERINNQQNSTIKRTFKKQNISENQQIIPKQIKLINNNQKIINITSLNCNNKGQNLLNLSINATQTPQYQKLPIINQKNKKQNQKIFPKTVTNDASQKFQFVQQANKKLLMPNKKHNKENSLVNQNSKQKLHQIFKINNLK